MLEPTGRENDGGLRSTGAAPAPRTGRTTWHRSSRKVPARCAEQEPGHGDRTRESDHIGE
ncbi:hypothetical protein AC792_05100 [Arthrobacter sp. RIT-PI-e]|nr:hypothetical protein AC792_05100 [Arthrobacter sp. RIT-PI-e]